MDKNQVCVVVSALSDRLEIPVSKLLLGGSAVMAFEGIREINDIDVYLTPRLWVQMCQAYKEPGEKTEHGFKIQFAGADVEFHYISAEQRNLEQMCFGCSKYYFTCLNHGREFAVRTWSIRHLLAKKLQWGREKDRADILTLLSTYHLTDHPDRIRFPDPNRAEMFIPV